MLADNNRTCLYGSSRIARHGVAKTEYFLTDALGSVRQLVAKIMVS